MTFVDALMTKLPSFNVRESGRLLARLQNGVVQVYGMVMAIGFVVVMAWYWTPHSRIEAVFFGDTALLRTPAGLGYEYRWDANSDGEFETGWTDEPQTSFEYDEGDTRAIVVSIEHAPSGRTEEIPASYEWRRLPLEMVIPDAERNERDSMVDFRLDEDGVVFLVPGRAPTGKRLEVRRPIGAAARFGSSLVYATPVVEARVEVRNAFGNTSVTTQRIPLPHGSDGRARASLGIDGGRR
jgi:hypothetical protein